MTVKKHLDQQIEVFTQPEPLPPGTEEHLNAFFENLKFSEYPEFDLTDPKEAAKAAQHATKVLEDLKQKMNQIKALEKMLATRSQEVKE